MIRAYENPLAFPGLRPAIQPVFRKGGFRLEGGDRLKKSRYTYSPELLTKQIAYGKSFYVPWSKVAIRDMIIQSDP